MSQSIMLFRVGLLAIALPTQAAAHRKNRVQAHGVAGDCPYGYTCSPAPCSVENSNGQPGPACACKDGFAKGITWDGSGFGGTCSEPAPCDVANSNGEPGPECACDKYSEGEVLWAGADASGHCEDKVQDLAALFATDRMLLHAHKRFKCCVYSLDDRSPIIQDMTVSPLPSARSFGSESGCGRMFGDHWHSASHKQAGRCLISFSGLAEATGIPRAVLIEKYEGAPEHEGAQVPEEEPAEPEEPEPQQLPEGSSEE